MLEMHFTVKGITDAALYISNLLRCKELGINGTKVKSETKKLSIIIWLTY